MRFCAEKIKRSLASRSDSTVIRPVTYIAMMCDIRFKRLCTVDPDVKAAIRLKFKHAMELEMIDMALEREQVMPE